MPPRTPKNVAKPAVIVKKKPKKSETSPVPASAQQPALATPQPEAEPRPAPTPQPPTPPLPAAAQTEPPTADTPPTPNRRQQDAQTRRALLTVFQERWPAVFPRDLRQVKPLARRIHYDIAAALLDTPLPLIKQTIALFQRWAGTRYLEAVRRGGPRYDLEGHPRGEVTPEEQELAHKDLRAFSERRRAAKPQAPGATGAAQPKAAPAEPASQ